MKDIKKQEAADKAGFETMKEAVEGAQERAKEFTQEVADKAEETFTEAAEEGRNFLTSAWENILGYTEEKPAQALAIALGIGVVLGNFLCSRKHG